jgi:hypothetical protein
MDLPVRQKVENFLATEASYEFKEFSSLERIKYGYESRWTRNLEKTVLEKARRNLPYTADWLS